MTLAERLHKEGKLEGKLEGAKEAIELGMFLKFPEHLDYVMAEVKKINDLATLVNIRDTIKSAKAVSELQRYLGGY